VDDYQRYVEINLPHTRAVHLRIGRTLDFLGAFREDASPSAPRLQKAFEDLEHAAAPYDDDPAEKEALAAADALAVRARTLVDAILEGSTRSDRLGQHVRNLFECLGLGEEGAGLGLACGERPDSPLR
jgi:hypothetical protein